MPYAILYPVVITLLVAALFLLTMWWLYKFFLFMWRKLPSSVVGVDAAQFDKVLAVLLSLVLFPTLLTYAWSVVGALMKFVTDFITNLAQLQIPAACHNDPDGCTSALSASVDSFLSGAASRIVDALNLSRFPVESFVWFLLAAIVANQIIGLLHIELTSGRLQAWGLAGVNRISAKTRQRVVFGCLLIVSFYLGLSALLAIPLFQEKNGVEQLTAENLVKAMADDEMKPDEFDKAFPADLTSTAIAAPLALPAPLPVLDGAQATTSDAGAAAPKASPVVTRFVDSETQLRQQMLGDIQQIWSRTRSFVLNDEGNSRDQAKYLFSSGAQSSSGRKQTARHYFDLLGWHKEYMSQEEGNLRGCLDSVASFQSTSSRTLSASRAALTSSGFITQEAMNEINSGRQQLYNQYDVARSSCQLGYLSSLPPIPQRRSLSDILGPVGSWARWLLDTEQMPVVIIVGLVGFSLLGATVSRAVRAGDDSLTTGISLDDLLIVIAGGTTAAVVVFLGAYGGLAVLGNSGGDPNPYIVFATCLIGAVYSEDVWTWARRRLLTPALDQGEPQGGQAGQQQAGQQGAGAAAQQQAAAAQQQAAAAAQQQEAAAAAARQQAAAAAAQ
jgi:hypothetical protein